MRRSDQRRDAVFACYQRDVTGAIVTELRTVFLGAAVCAGIAAVAAGLLLRGRAAPLGRAAPFGPAAA